MSYQRQSPDYTYLVRRISDQFPREWDLANKQKYGERADAFIRRFAWEAHQVDSRIGLNGKRGNVNDISRDAIAYKNGTVPEHLGQCEVIDIITGDHRPTWQDVTIISTPQNPDGVPGAWIEPEDPDLDAETGHGTGGGNNPDYSSTVDLQAQIDEIKRILEKTFKAGDKVTFKTQAWGDLPAKYVCGDHNQGNHLIANREEPGPWEKFTIDKG